jgi:hypothetical protein
VEGNYCAEAVCWVCGWISWLLVQKLLSLSERVRAASRRAMCDRRDRATGRTHSRATVGRAAAVIEQRSAHQSIHPCAETRSAASVRIGPKPCSRWIGGTSQAPSPCTFLLRDRPRRNLLHFQIYARFCPNWFVLDRHSSPNINADCRPGLFSDCAGTRQNKFRTLDHCPLPSLNMRCDSGLTKPKASDHYAQVQWRFFGFIKKLEAESIARWLY